MSVINRMLADLERRGALSGSEAAALELRPVLPGKRPAAPMLAAVAAVALAGAWMWSAGPAPKPQPAAPAPAAAPTAAAPVDRGEAPELSARVSDIPPASESPNTPVRRPATPAAPPSQELAQTPQSAPRAQAAAAAGERGALQRASAPRAQAAADAPPSARSATTREGSDRGAGPPARVAAGAAPDSAIDKHVHQPTPRQRAEAEFSRGVALMQQGRAGEAIEGLNAALQTYAGHEAARQVLAALLVDARRTAEAEQVLEEGVRLNPGNARLALALARIQVERGGWEAALETLRRSEGAAAGDADYQGFMGSVLQRLSRHAEAIPCYLAAVRLAPQSGIWYLGLGISLEAEGRAADARESFQRAKAAGTLGPELVAFIDQRLAGLAGKP